MADKWIPNYIKRNINYKPRDVLTAQEYNAILNLLISQGDYNSSWLEYLQNDAIPEAIREIGEEEIEEVLTNAVREAIAALAASVVNKTSAQLNYPMVTLLNVGQNNVGIAGLRTLLLSKSLAATYAIATNLVGTTTAYPSIGQLNTLVSEGNDIVPYSTDGATITTSTAEAVATAAKEYMETHEFNSNVFVYPNGNSDSDVRNTVCGIFKYAVNIINDDVITPDGILPYSPASVLGNLAVIHVDSTVTEEDIEAAIDEAVQYNKYIILQINTDSADYDDTQLENILDYVLENTSIVFPETISDAMQTIHETIDNRLETVEDIYVTESDGVKYLNW